MLNANVINDIKNHAEKEYPNECCGVVIEYNGVKQYIPCKNIVEDKTEEFKIDPHDFTDAADIGEIVGIVHSHPDAQSRPSTHDIAAMERMYAMELLADPEAKPTPWYIISWPDGDFRECVAKGNVPLLGRDFVHNFYDCWQACADYYLRQYNLVFPNYDRKDGWWEDKDAHSWYEEEFESVGFDKVDIKDIQVGDLVIMQIGRTYHPNHAAVYLGSNPTLPNEQLNVHGHGPFIYHHMHGRKSCIEIYGGQWLQRTRFVLRHKTASRGK